MSKAFQDSQTLQALATLYNNPIGLDMPSPIQIMHGSTADTPACPFQPIFMQDSHQFFIDQQKKQKKQYDCRHR